MPCAARRARSAGSSAARTPWAIRRAPRTSSAARTPSEPANSPACGAGLVPGQAEADHPGVRPAGRETGGRDRFRRIRVAPGEHQDAEADAQPGARAPSLVDHLAHQPGGGPVQGGEVLEGGELTGVRRPFARQLRECAGTHRPFETQMEMGLRQTNQAPHGSTL
ncbi:hypothetical protein [Streptomyces roseirectus]|uniref:hypothetical protein n=1 Tax=Streptomyces roseirectus TaxID=2768066 RepID=UPI001FE9562E|nr:hypothetical protein [Streptomyces roseirectus]